MMVFSEPLSAPPVLGILMQTFNTANIVLCSYLGIANSFCYLKLRYPSAVISFGPGGLYVLLLRCFADLLATPSGSNNAFIIKRTAQLSITNPFSLNLQSITLQPKEDKDVLIFVRINSIISFIGVFCFLLHKPSFLNRQCK